jgi:hypothetical protein
MFGELSLKRLQTGLCLVATPAESFSIAPSDTVFDLLEVERASAERFDNTSWRLAERYCH